MIVSHFTQYGIPPAIMHPRGFGDSRPAGSMKSDRRVEITLMEEGGPAIPAPHSSNGARSNNSPAGAVSAWGTPKHSSSHAQRRSLQPLARPPLPQDSTVPTADCLSDSDGDDGGGRLPPEQPSFPRERQEQEQAEKMWRLQNGIGTLKKIPILKQMGGQSMVSVELEMKDRWMAELKARHREQVASLTAERDDATAARDREVMSLKGKIEGWKSKFGKLSRCFDKARAPPALHPHALSRARVKSGKILF